MGPHNLARRLAPEPERDPEACLRRAADYLEAGGLKDAAFWTRLAAEAIAERKRGH